MDLVDATLDRRLFLPGAVTIRFSCALGRGRLTRLCGFRESKSLEVDASRNQQCSSGGNGQPSTQHGFVGIVTERSGNEAEANKNKESADYEKPVSGFRRHCALFPLRMLNRYISEGKHSLCSMVRKLQMTKVRG